MVVTYCYQFGESMSIENLERRKCDTLVIGAGGGGLRAALHLA